MYIEHAAIQAFVSRALQLGKVAKVVRELNIQPEKLEKIVVDYFLDMGMLEVAPFQYAELMVDKLIIFIQRSPEIRKILAQNRQKEESMKMQRKFEGMQ